MGQVYKCSECKFESQNKSFFEAHLRRSKHVQFLNTQQPENFPEIVIEPELKEEIPEVIVKKSKKQKANSTAEELVNESEE